MTFVHFFVFVFIMTCNLFLFLFSEAILFNLTDFVSTLWSCFDNTKLERFVRPKGCFCVPFHIVVVYFNYDKTTRSLKSTHESLTFQYASSNLDSSLIILPRNCTSCVGIYHIIPNHISLISHLSVWIYQCCNIYFCCWGFDLPPSMGKGRCPT